MRKVLFILLVAYMTNVSAQSTITAHGPIPNKGEKVQGIVKNADGPMLGVDVLEINIDHKVVAAGATDINGRFSFKLADTASVLEASPIGYYPVSSKIIGNQYEIVFESDPNVNLDSLYQVYADEVARSFALLENDPYPIIWLGSKELFPNMKEWQDIDWRVYDKSKESYTKKEISLLLGIDVKDIKKVRVHRGKDAVDILGERAKNGFIHIETRNDN